MPTVLQFNLFVKNSMAPLPRPPAANPTLPSAGIGSFHTGEPCLAPSPSCFSPAVLGDSVRWWLPAQALDQTDLDALLAQPFTCHVTYFGPPLKWEQKHLAPRLSVNLKWIMHAEPLGFHARHVVCSTYVVCAQERVRVWQDSYRFLFTYCNCLESAPYLHYHII